MKQYFSSGGGFGGTVYAALMLLGIGYFMYAALEGDYGKFRQMQILAQKTTLQSDLEQVQSARLEVENRVHRLSDHYLDLDLLDERARKVLGLMRSDEIIIQ